VSWTTVSQAVAAGLANGAFYAFLALAFAAIFRLTRALNLAHGEWVLLGGYLGYTAGRLSGWPPLLLAPLAAAALVPVGLAWRALLHRVREPVELNSMALTFGLALLLQNAMLATWSADYRIVATAGEGGAATGILGLGAPRAVAAGVALVTLVGLQLLLDRTRWGTALRATARDAETAALLGVNTDRVAAVSFAAAALPSMTRARTSGRAVHPTGVLLHASPISTPTRPGMAARGSTSRWPGSRTISSASAGILRTVARSGAA